jgi:hypothetical protein
MRGDKTNCDGLLPIKYLPMQEVLSKSIKSKYGNWLRILLRYGFFLASLTEDKLKNVVYRFLCMTHIVAVNNNGKDLLSL